MGSTSVCPLPSIQPSVQRLADTKLPTTGQNGATWPVVESIAPDGLVAVRRAQNNRAVQSLTIGRVSFAASSGTHCRHASHLCGRQGRSPRRERPQLQAGNRCLPHGRASLHADAEGKHARGGHALRYAFAKLVAGGKPRSGLIFPPMLLSCMRSARHAAAAERRGERPHPERGARAGRGTGGAVVGRRCVRHS